MEKQTSWKSWIGFGLRILVGVSLLAIVLYMVDRRKVWEAFQQADLRIFAVFFPVFGLIGLIGAIRWRMLLACQEIDISLWEALKLTLLGYFFSFTPAGLAGGDLAKAVYAAGNTRHRARAAVSVAMDRLVGTVAIGIIALTGLLIWPDDPITKKARFVVFLMAAITCAICTIFFCGGIGVINRLAKRFPLWGLSEELLKARNYYWNNKRTLLAALGISFFGHFGSIVLFYGFGLSLGVKELGFTDYVIAVPTISFISCLSAMGLGIGELSSQWLFTSKGVAKDVAVAISMMYRISLIVWSIPGGFVALFYRRRKSASLPEECPDA